MTIQKCMKFGFSIQKRFLFQPLYLVLYGHLRLRLEKGEAKVSKHSVDAYKHKHHHVPVTSKSSGTVTSVSSNLVDTVGLVEAIRNIAIVDQLVLTHGTIKVFRALTGVIEPQILALATIEANG